MLKNYSQAISEVQKWLGYPTLDETTDIPLSLVQTFYNDSLREIFSGFNYRQAEKPILLPFLHTINNVQGAFLSGTSVTPVAGSGMSATLTPFPINSANGLLVNDTVINDYSGIGFTGTDSLGNTYSGVSTLGNITYTNLQNQMGYVYELPSKIEQIYSVTIPPNSIKLRYVPQYDWDRAVPQGLTIASGTPSSYTMFPGLSPSGNLMIQFYPQPTAVTYNNAYLQIHYKRKHQDLVNPTDIQSLLPEQFQDILMEATLEKCLVFLSDEMSQYHGKRKEARMEELQTWAENSLDYVYVFRDGDFLSTSSMTPYNTSVLFRL